VFRRGYATLDFTAVRERDEYAAVKIRGIADYMMRGEDECLPAALQVDDRAATRGAVRRVDENRDR
jgi:hypothetical protein